MSYADYDYYKNDYLGTALGEEDFPRLALRASRYLDRITGGRAAEKAELEAVKAACCALAEQAALAEKAGALAASSLSADEEGGGQLTRESVGSWSRSYRSGGDSAAAAQRAEEKARAALSRTAREYLAGTGLLYRGGRRCPCSGGCSRTP